MSENTQPQTTETKTEAPVETEGQSQRGTIAQGMRAWEAAMKEAEATTEASEPDAETAEAVAEEKPEAGETEPEVKADAETESDEKPKLDRIAELARQAREKRLAKEREHQEKTSQESAKAELEAARKELEAERQRFKSEMEEFYKDPATFALRKGQDPSALLDRMVKLSTNKGEVILEEKLRSIEEQNKALQERLERYESGTKEQEEQRQVQYAQQAQLQAKQDFVKHVARNESKYSVLAGEDPAMVAEWAVQVAVQAQDAGRKVDFDDIAGMLEEQLRANLERQYARYRSDKPEPGEAKKPQKRARGETLTNAQAAQRSAEESRPMTARERVEAAKRAFAETYRNADS